MTRAELSALARRVETEEPSENLAYALARATGELRFRWPPRRTAAALRALAMEKKDD